MANILLLNGPNLNLLGSREPEVYGATRLADIEARCRDLAVGFGHELDCFQTNAEHELINRAQAAARDKVDFIILNPGAFTHTSIAKKVGKTARSAPLKRKSTIQFVFSFSFSFHFFFFVIFFE